MAIAFDLVQPWAWLRELSSTHPLTAKRIRRLDVDSKKKIFDEGILSTVDKGKVWSHFFKDFFVQYAPWVLIIGFVASAFYSRFNGIAIFPLVIGYALLFILSLIVKVIYKYPTSHFPKSTVLDCMADIYMPRLSKENLSL